MTLMLRHAQALTRELIRYPAYVVPTLLFPSVFFLFFAPGTASGAILRLATFTGFAAIGVSFFQFGVGIAVERASPWETYLRTLPIGPTVRLGARVLSAALFSFAAAGLLAGVAVAATGVTLTPARWLMLALALLAGMVPFALLGIALGYWSPERGALPIANLLYLGLSYAGGLWFRPRDLPGPISAISPYLPTRALSKALIAAVSGGSIPWRPWFVLGLFAAIFGVLAALGYRRDEGRRFT